MTKPLVVVDASVALAWYLPDTEVNYQYANAVRSAHLNNRIITVVPDFWAAEIAYKLIKTARSKPSKLSIPLDEAATFLDHFPQNIQPTAQSVSHILDLATRYFLQGWDAIYFDIAIRQRASLATLDGGLKTACLRFGVPMWEAQPA